MCQDKGSLVKQKQRLCAEAKENAYLFSTSYQQVMSTHLPGGKASVCVAVALEDECYSNECPTLFIFLLGFIAEHISHVVE